eukprot:gene7908-1120_t
MNTIGSPAVAPKASGTLGRLPPTRPGAARGSTHPMQHASNPRVPAWSPVVRLPPAGLRAVQGNTNPMQPSSTPRVAAWSYTSLGEQACGLAPFKNAAVVGSMQQGGHAHRKSTIPGSTEDGRGAGGGSAISSGRRYGDRDRNYDNQASRGGRDERYGASGGRSSGGGGRFSDRSRGQLPPGSREGNRHKDSLFNPDPHEAEGGSIKGPLNPSRLMAVVQLLRLEADYFGVSPEVKEMALAPPAQLPDLRDRALAKDIVAGVTTLRRRLDFIISKLTNKTATEMEPGMRQPCIGTALVPSESLLLSQLQYELLSDSFALADGLKPRISQISSNKAVTVALLCFPQRRGHRTSKFWVYKGARRGLRASKFWVYKGARRGLRASKFWVYKGAVGG